MTDQQALIDAATAVRLNAHTPYSGFPVGAAVRLRDGRIFTGVNVENCSFPLTVCAERNAVAAAVAAGAKPGDVEAVAVAAAAAGLPSPCGACRQVLAEFASGDVPIHMLNLADDTTETATVAELLPRAFTAGSLRGP